MENQKRSSADHADIQRRLLSITILVFSLIYATKVAFYFVDGALSEYLTYAGYGLAALALVMIITTIYWKLRFIPVNERYQLLSSEDSFANAMMNKSFKHSWMYTLLLLFLISSLIDKQSSTYPAQFYIDLSVFLMLSTFSLSFIILFRVENEEAIEGEGV